jgi:hypothetical protein
MEEENARLVMARISHERRFENQYVLFGLYLLYYLYYIYYLFHEFFSSPNCLQEFFLQHSFALLR